MTTTQDRTTDDATRMSTQPRVSRQAGPSLPALLKQTWRTLTSMRTALLLLFLLALAAVPGGFLPQRPISPAAVQDFLARHTTTGPLLDRVGAFDVFAAPWFAAIYLLLTVSLLGCLVPRWRLHLRAMLRPPPTAPAHLSRLPASDRWRTDADAGDVLREARRLLRRSRWRTVVRGTAVSAEKGQLRETGNLVFHVALVVLLVAIALGSFFGFSGGRLLKEGDAFANAVFNYDDVQPGSRFDASRLEPFTVGLEDFRVTWDEDGRPLTFDADLRWTDAPGEPEQTRTIRVNEPLTVGAARVYLIGHGYAPRVQVLDPSGAVAFEDSVPCLPSGPEFVSSCTIKVPNGGGVQYGFEGVFTPTTVQDPETGEVTSVYPGLENPVLTVLGWTGDLGLEVGTPQSVYALDTSRLDLLDPTPQALRVGDTWQMPDGGSIRLVGVEQWATFQVSQDPGKVLALVAAVLMVSGLLLSLSVRRRRVWVRVVPTGGDAAAGRTVVEVGGLARTSPEAFEDEFAELGRRLRAVAPPYEPEDASRHQTAHDRQHQLQED